MGVSEMASYEESRQRRLEENKKRMEELNLHKLSASLRTATSPKSSPVKKSNPRTPRSPVNLSAVRRSSRFVDKPSPNYKEELIEPLGGPKTKRSYQRRDLLNRVYASDEARAYAVERAEELQTGLETEFPSFVKPMLQSHVTGGFWLGLPVHFCKMHLPNHDEMITLADEDGNESPVKYLAEKTGLSGGWRGFAIDHELVDGDALVFQLIKPTKFQVYIIKSDQSKDGDDDSDASPVEVNAKRTRASKKSDIA